MVIHDTESLLLQKIKIGEILFSAGILSREQLNYALKTQELRGGRIGEVLLELGLVSSSSLVSALRAKFLTQSADLYDMELSSQVLGLLPLELMKRFEVLPLSREADRVFLAMTDPHDQETLKKLSFYLNRSNRALVFSV